MATKLLLPITIRKRRAKLLRERRQMEDRYARELRAQGLVIRLLHARCPHENIRRDVAPYISESWCRDCGKKM